MAKKKQKLQFIEIFEKKSCNISTTCKAVGVNRNTFYNWLKSDPKFAQEIENLTEGLLDIAESKLFEAIKRGKLRAITFFLNTKGRKRGYGDKDAEKDNGLLEELIKVMGNKG